MEKLFEFLNAQSGERLLGYGVIFLFVVYYVTNMFIQIFKSFNKKSSKEKHQKTSMASNSKKDE